MGLTWLAQLSEETLWCFRAAAIQYAVVDMAVSAQSTGSAYQPDIGFADSCSLCNWPALMTAKPFFP